MGNARSGSKLQAQLIRRDGSVVWEQTSFAPPNSRLTQPQFPDRMRQDPTLTAESLRRAAQIAAANAVRTLDG